jgi:VanZ family protein
VTAAKGEIAPARSWGTAVDVFGWWAPVVAYAAAIFAVSSMSQPPVPGAIPDYAVHGWEYAGFALVVLRALAQAQWNRVTAGRVVLTVAIAAAYGLSDELHQRLVPGRVFDFRDLLADGVGAAVAAGTVYVARLVRFRVASDEQRSSHDDIPSADLT